MHGLAILDRIWTFNWTEWLIVIGFIENKVSAASAKNLPELKSALDYVREDDIFVVTKLDRQARSVVALSNIVQRLEEKKVNHVVHDQWIDTTTIYGKLQFNILAAIR